MVIGKYIVDEGEGIELMSQLYGNRLLSDFTYKDIFLRSTYEFNKNEIIFSVSSSKIVKGEEGDVKNYSINSFQIVQLRKNK